MFPHDKAMSRAKIGLMYDRSTAFYAAVAMRLPFHWDNSQPTAYTDYKNIGLTQSFSWSCPQMSVYSFLHMKPCM